MKRVLFAVAVALVAVSAKDVVARADVDISDTRTTCCMGDGACFRVLSELECEQAQSAWIQKHDTAEPATDGVDVVVDDENETGCLHVHHLQEGRPGVVRVRVQACSELPSEEAPVPTDAVQATDDWLLCEVTTCDAAEPLMVNWPVYSRSYLEGFPAFQDPAVGATFLIRLESFEERLRVRGAEQMEGPCAL